MAKLKIKRRTFLAGLGGTAIALPWLEIMEQTARAAGPSTPCRYLVSFGGLSIGHIHECVPSVVGPDYDLPRSLASIGQYTGLREYISVVSGLRIPWTTGTTPPAGGRLAPFHGSTESPLLSGVRSTVKRFRVLGQTSDTLVANAIGNETRFPSLSYRVQVDSYRNVAPEWGIMSYGLDGAGKVEARPPIVSPRIAFESLFFGFAPPDSGEVEERRALLEQGKSVIDLVRRRSDRLQSSLGTEDLRRLDRHFTEIRELELRVKETPVVAGACQVLADPGEDPSTVVETNENQLPVGWSQETLRGRLFGDLIHMAFVCDLTRSIALQLSFSQTFLSANPITGRNTDVHELSHGGDKDLPFLADTYAWHVNQIAYIADKMRNTEEGGQTLLDHAALVFVAEGGRGIDPVNGRDLQSHSSENMMALVAGRAGGLKSGQHIVAKDEHPAKVLISAMNAVGAPGDLGEVSGQIPELFV